MNKERLHTLLPLVLILIFAFVVRLYGFTSPIADWHSWRQADTSAVSRNFIQHGFDVLYPRFDDLSNVPSGFDNPNGYRFVEFPIYNVFQAGLFWIFGGFTIEQWGRIVTIISSLFSIVMLYLLFTKYGNRKIGLITAFFYAFLPFNIYYGRVILPDPTMVAAILGGIYFFDLWVEKSNTYTVSRIQYWNFFLLSLLFTASALLLKPYAIFFTLPMVYLAWKRWGISFLTKWQLWLFMIVSIAPLLFWRQWMTQFPEGIPVNEWLMNGNGIRFRPAFFRWMVYERVTKLISGYVGLFFLIPGIILALRQKHAGFFLAFIISSVLYVTVFATGNVQHDYYQILVMPTIAMLFGLGGYAILHLNQYRKYLGSVLFVLLSIGTCYFGWRQIQGYFNINNPVMITAGKAVEANTKPEDKVIALYDGDTSFLYQTNRQGWASFQDPLPEMIEKGANYLVQLHPTPGDITLYETEYTIVASSSGFVVVKLE